MFMRLTTRAKRIFASGLLTVMMLPGAAAQDSVRVLARTDYLGPELTKDALERRGLSVEIDVYDPTDSEALRARLLGGSEAYDLVIVPAAFLTAMINAGKLDRLDRQIAGTHQVSAQVRRFMLRYGAGGAEQPRFYSVPFMLGSSGIGFDADRLAAPPTALADIFDPERAAATADCGIGLADAPAEIVGAVLAYLGRDPASRAPDDLAAAEAALIALRPMIKGFYGEEIGDRLADGTLCIALGWSGSILRASLAARDAAEPRRIGYAIPEVGAPLWIDMLAVPVEAANKDAAYRLIEFMLDAEVGAAISRGTLFPSANMAANNLNWDEGLFDDKRIFPRAKIVDTMFVVPASTSDEAAALGALWGRVKAAGGN